MRKVLAIVVALVLAGCSSSMPDTEPPSSTSRPPSVRPREIKLDNVDPCGLLPDDSVKMAGLNSGPMPGQHPTFQAPTCRFYSTVQSTELKVTPVLTLGIERFEPGRRTGEARSRTVQGFRSLEIYSPGACTVVVDVADGQVLHLSFGEPTGRQFNEEVMCRMAIELATIAMRTLLVR